MHTSETPFISLAEILRAGPIAPTAQAAPAPATSAPPVPGPIGPVPVMPGPIGLVPATPTPSTPPPVEQTATLREFRLFRAALADAFDAIVANLTRELALHVLARELRLAAVDIDTLARQLIAQCLAEEPLCLRVAPADAHVACELAVTVDPELRPGDAILECRSGSIDARLCVRLAGVLATVEA